LFLSIWSLYEHSFGIELFILIACQSEFYLYLSEEHSVTSSTQTTSSPAHVVTSPN